MPLPFPSEEGEELEPTLGPLSIDGDQGGRREKGMEFSSLISLTESVAEQSKRKMSSRRSVNFSFGTDVGDTPNLGEVAIEPVE